MKKLPGVASKRARRIFPTNPDLADILGRADLSFENVSYFFFWGGGDTILDFQVPRSPNSQIPRFPGSQIPKFPGYQISRRRSRTNSQIST